jgi:hypothetical protein
MKTKIISFMAMLVIVLIGNGCGCCFSPQSGRITSSGSFLGVHYESETVVQNYNDNQLVPTIFNTQDHFDKNGNRILEYNINGQWVQVNNMNYSSGGIGRCEGGNVGNHPGPIYYNR